MVPGFLLDLVVRPSKRQEREWSMTSKVIIPDWLCHGRDNWCSKGGHLTWLSSSNLWWLSCPCPFKPIGSFRDADISFKFPHCPKHFPMPGLLPLVPLGICFPHVILFCVFWWRLINLLLTSLILVSTCFTDRRKGRLKVKIRPKNLSLPIKENPQFIRGKHRTSDCNLLYESVEFSRTSINMLAPILSLLKNGKHSFQP